MAKYKVAIHAVFISMVFILSQQFLVLRGFSLAQSGNAVVAWAEVLIIAYAFFVAYKLFIKKQFVTLSRVLKLMLIVVFVLGLYYFACLIWRVGNKVSIAGDFMVARVLFFSMVLFFGVILEKMSLRSVVYSLILSCSWLNLQLIGYLCCGISLRESNILGNILVYDTFIILAFPFLILFYCKGNLSRSLSICVLLNLFFSFLFLAFSGSRFSFIFILFEVAVVFMCTGGFKSTKLKKSLFIGCYTISFLIVVLLSFLHVPNLSSNCFRSLHYPYQVVQKIYNSIQHDSSNNIFKEIEVSQELIDSPLSNVADNAAIYNAVSTEKSNSYRGYVWDSAKNQISENFLFGIGRSSVYVPGNGYQNAHNFILEYLLYWGFFGFCLCCVIYLIPLIFFCIQKVSFPVLITVFICYLGVFSISFVQPIISTKLEISIFFWMLMAPIFSLKDGADWIGD